MSCNKLYRRSPILPALVVIAIGVFILLRNFGIVFVEDWGQLWPVILIVIGVAKLIKIFERPEPQHWS